MNSKSDSRVLAELAAARSNALTLCEQRVDEATEKLSRIRESLDRLLDGSFDADTRSILAQVQVHVHEALLLLQADCQHD